MEGIGTKTIVITWCNKGVGYGILMNLAQRPEPHRLIMAVRSAELGRTALAELEKLVPHISDRVTIHELDISISASIDQFVQWIKDSSVHVDCLLNNAGMAYHGDIFNEEVIRVTFQTNFYGTVELTEKMSPYMSESSKVIFVASSVGKLERLKSPVLKQEFDSPTITREQLYALAKRFYDDVVANVFEKNGWPRSAYGISKLCLNIYTRILARNPDILKRNIQVYSCCPGWVRTDMAGPQAPRTIQEGAVCPCDLVYLPWHINPELQGKFFYDSKVTPI